MGYSLQVIATPVVAVATRQRPTVGSAAEVRSHMLHILAAVAAVTAALLEFTLGTYLKVGTAVPHLVLVFGVIWTVTSGIERGLTWAFLGGIALDVLAPRPLGGSAFALIVAVGIAAAFGALFGRARPFAPILATFICSLAYSMLILVASIALKGPVAITDPIDAFLPGALYDTVLATLVGPLLVSVVMKRRDAERAEW